jgi:ATP-dependent RNA helicase RhlE
MNNTKTRKSGKRNFPGNNGYRRRSFRSNGKGKTSSITDPNMLIKKAIPEEEIVFNPSRSFNQMPIHRRIKANLVRKGFNNPTQIQDSTLEHLVEGRNLIGVATTGTGKTAAFLIPIIEQLLNSSRPFTTLVIVPTRELALQIKEEFRSISEGMGLYSVCLIGGTNLGRDIAQLRKKNHIIIGTPGRLMDLAQRGALRLQNISSLVLDEFDRMLDMGFVDDIKKMVRLMPNRKQTMLFSATIDKMQQSLINQMVQNPVEIKVSSGASTSDQVDQDIIRVPKGFDKFEMLLNLIDDVQFEKVLIFAETKRLVDRVNKKLNQSEALMFQMLHTSLITSYR